MFVAACHNDLPTGNSASALSVAGRHESRSRRRRPILLPAVLLVILGCLGPSVACRAEQSDSGWVIARPSVLGVQNGPADPSLQIAISHALQQTASAAEKGTKPEQQRAARVARRDDPGKVWLLPTSSTKQDAEPGAKDRPQATDGQQRTSDAEAQSDGESPSQSIPAGATPVAEPDTDVAATEAAAPADESAAADATADDGDANEPSSEAADGEQTAAEPEEEVTLPPLTRSMMNLRARLRTVLKAYYRQPLALNTRDNTPWEVMHAMLAYELRSRILQGGPRGTPITSIGWLCYNKPCKGQQMLRLTPDGELRALYGVGLEGHGGQFLSMLAQCGVSPDYPILVDGHKFTIHDLIAAEQKTCHSDAELSFKLTGLTHYVDLDATWENDKGETWDFPRLIREELSQPINGVACGGTHRLIGLSMAVRARRRQGEPLDGEYAEAAQKVQQYQQYAFRLQNRDGSLSTEWFRGPGNDRDIDRNVRTTGHQLEWLVYSLGDQQLRDWHTVRAVIYLTNLLYSNYDNEWDTGALSHAVHALALYDERVFQPYDNRQGVASSSGDKSATRSYSRARR